MVNNYTARFKNPLLVLISLLLSLSSMAQTTVMFPAGNPTGGPTDRKPYGVYYGWERSDMIYTAAEHTIPTGSIITQIGFFLNSNNGNPPNQPYNVKVY